MRAKTVLSSILAGPDGRMRLGWRLILFLTLTLSIAVPVIFLDGYLSGTPTEIGASVGLLLGSILAGWWLLTRDKRGFSALGFYFSSDATKESIRGLALGIGIGVVVITAIFLLGGVRWTPESGTISGWLLGAFSALAFFTIPAAMEEAVVRGYAFQAVVESWGVGAALTITAIIFGALHYGNPDFGWVPLVNITLAGVLLGVVYLKTLSLWWATGVHLGWNWTLGYLADVPVSGLELMDAPYYEGHPVGPEWLSGGGFGPEASLIAAVVLLLASILLWWGPWLCPGPSAASSNALAYSRMKQRGNR